MLNNNEKKILFSIKFLPIIIIIVFSVLLTYFFISQNNKILKIDSEQLKNNFIQKNEELIKRDVNIVYNLIEYEKENTLKNLKQEIQNRVNDAYDTAHNIYNNNKHLNKKIIIQKIKEALRYIKFNDGRGYYFIYELEGKNILFPGNKELEGTNLWNFKDAKNNYTIRKLSEIALNKKEGFHTWYWYKPNKDKQMSNKIGFVKYFEPLNWFIGTGEYLEDFEKKVKQNTLDRISKINYNRDGYVFVVNYDGVILNHINKKTINKNKIDIKDKNGLYIAKEIIKIAKQGEGFLKYIPILNTRESSNDTKTAYIKGFEDWNWAIGSGFYEVDSNLLIKEKEKNLIENTKNTLNKILITISITTLIIIILLMIFSNAIKKIFEKYITRNKSYQKKLKNLLYEKSRKLNDSMETINSYVSMTKTDINGVIVYASDNFCKSLKYTKEELIGKPHSIVRHPDNKKILFKKMWDTISAGHSFKTVMKDLTKDGKDFWFELLIYPEFDKNKKIIGYTALRNDLNDKKRIERINKSLEKKIKDAVKVNREKDFILSQQSKLAAMGEMLENIAHQWRQPLSVISTAASGMKLQKDYKHLDDEQFYKSIHNILSNTEYLSETINTFRDFLKSKKEKTLFNIKDTFEKTSHLIESKYVDSDITIIKNIEDIKMIGLDSELIQIFMNILTNAKDAFNDVDKNQKKYIFIDIFKEDTSIYIKIKDNAGGIDDEVMDKIFEPYFTTKHKAQGTGIGLYMCKEIASNQMNGDLTVQNITFDYENISYNGAEFTLTLPIIVQDNND